MNRPGRVLVTGANGFVGRQAVAALIRSGIEVSSLGRTKPDDPQVEHYTCDLLDKRSDLRGLLQSAAADTLIHLAWTTGHGHFWSAPENIGWLGASSRLIETFVEVGGRRMVAAGTCAEYFAPLTGPCIADATPIYPRHLYSATKHALHLRLADLARATGTSYLWGRVFLLVGPGENSKRLVPDVILNLKENREANCSLGLQIRDIMDVRDCGRAIAASAISDHTGPINIGSGIPVTIGSIVEQIAQKMDRQDLLRLGALPSRPDEPTNLYGEVQQWQRKLGFCANYSLSKSLDDAIAYWTTMS